MNIIKENEDDAHEFINGYGHDTPETREEFEAILSNFGAASAHYALKWAADWIENGANANNNPDVKEFTANMAMTIRAVAAQAIKGA